MKSRTLISFLMVLDLSLAAVLAWGIRNRSAGASPGERGSPPVLESLPAAAGGENAPVGREAGAAAISPSRGTPLWASLRSRDLRTFAAHLRAAGCPEDTVRDIILAEVNRLFAPRERPLRLRRRHQLPWEKPSLHPLAIEENLRKLRKLVREKQELLSQALGYRVFLEAPELSSRHQRHKYEAAYARLPEEKRQGVRAVHDLYLDKAAALKARTLGYLEEEDQDELRRLKAERRVGLEGLLSPEELEEFDLETSHAAELARSRLEGFDATDQEHRALYRLFAAEEARSSVDRAGEEVLEQQISEVLGEERYAQLKSSRTPEFQRFARIAEESGLPRDRAAEAYQICEALKEEAERLEADPELSEAERREALTALGGETEQALLETLGKAGLEKLKSSGAALPPSAGRRAKGAR